MTNMKKWPREIRDVLADWWTFKAAAERPEHKGMQMNLMGILEMGSVDQVLADRHYLRTTEDWRTLDPYVLAARIRGQMNSEAVADDPHLERAAALLFATYHGDSMEESRELLRRYLQLLDSGHRPLLGDALRLSGLEPPPVVG